RTMVPFCLDQTYRNGMVIDEVIQVPPSLFISGRMSIIGWASGTSIDSQDTLSFSVLSGVKYDSEQYLQQLAIKNN
ncbi:MAG: hypothetical protein ACJ71P_02035, partial [Nitrososphaeraceae archaeon]